MNISIRNILLGRTGGRRSRCSWPSRRPAAASGHCWGWRTCWPAIAVPEPFSLELAGDANGVTLLARCLDDQVVSGQIAARYPQARIQTLDPEGRPPANGGGRDGLGHDAAGPPARSTRRSAPSGTMTSWTRAPTR